MRHEYSDWCTAAHTFDMKTNQTGERLTMVSELQFLPSTYYLAVLAGSDRYMIEQWENYNKGSFRNKCMTSGNQRFQYLIIPLQKGKHRSQSIRDVKISYDEDWITPMRHRLQTEFGSLPYFEYYIHGFEHILSQQWEFLFDLNAHIFGHIVDLVGLPLPSFTSRYDSYHLPETLDLRDRITPRFFRDQPRLMEPMDLDYFTFIPANTILECLFSYGPETELLLRKYGSYLKDNIDGLF